MWQLWLEEFGSVDGKNQWLCPDIATTEFSKDPYQFSHGK